MNLQSLTAGDTLNFATTVAAYSAGDGWTLKYRLVPRIGTNPAISLVSTPEGDDHRILVAAATTADWAADNYSWTSWVEKAAEFYSVDSGQIIVRPDPRTMAPGVDARSQAVRAVADLKTAYAAFASSRGMQQSYKIADREMVFKTAVEIIKAISYWEGQVNKEDLAAGRRPAFSGRILTRI